MSTVDAESMTPRAAGPAPALPKVIRSKIGALRRAVRRWFFIEGLSRLSLCLAGFVCLSLVVDRFGRMDRPQRMIFLLAGCAVAAAIAYRWLMVPLGRRLSDIALCFRVELGYSELRERVISAVEFSQMDAFGSSQSSPAMMRAAVAQGAEAAASVNFRSVLNASGHRRNLLSLGAGAAIVVMLFVIMPGTMGLWFRRNILLGNEPWPQDTHLVVKGLVDGGLTVPRGDDLTVEVEANGVVPSVVYVEYRDEEGEWEDTETLAHGGGREFRTVFENVVQPFIFRARGGDGETPWVPVALMERPKVEKFHLWVTPPAYTGMEREELPQGRSSHAVLRGSAVELLGTTNKPLASLALRKKDETPVVVGVDGVPSFRIAIPPDKLADGVYSIDLTDTEGLKSKKPFKISLRIRADKDPDVDAELTGVGDLVLARAVIPITFTIEDDFSVSYAGLRCDIKSTEEETIEGPRQQTSVALPFTDVADRLGAKEISSSFALEVASLKPPVDSRIDFFVEAKDNDAIAGPNTGTSAVFSLRVVSEEIFRADILRREQEQRMELEEILKDQERIQENTRVLQASVRGGSAMDGDNLNDLIKSEKQQRLMSERLTTVTEQFSAILEEIRNNRLEDDENGPLVQRLRTHIIEPLQELATGQVTKAADLLDTSRTSTKDASACGRLLAEAIGEQDAIIKTIQQVLRNIVKHETYQETINLLREIIETQGTIHEETRKMYEDRIKSIFEEE